MNFMNGSAERFQSYVEGKEIICFGAGKYLRKFFEKCPVNAKIKCVTDNDSSKWGCKTYANGVLVDIIPPNKLPDVLDERCIILITASYIGIEIIKDLLVKDNLGNTPVFYALFILYDNETFMPNYRTSMPESLRLCDAQLIPKIIHYAWFGPNKIPRRYQEFIDGWKRLCPDYEFMLWNEKNYDIEKNKYMKKAYEQKIWGFVPDYLRKDVVYEYGGIYLDTDVEMVKKPDDLLYQKGFCGIELGFIVALGLGFGATKHLPVMKELRDIYEDEEFIYQGSKTKTAPRYDTEFFLKHGYVPNGELQTVREMTIYPFEVLSGTMFFSDTAPVTENTYTIHHYTGSWLDEKTKDQADFLAEIYKEFKSI